MDKYKIQYGVCPKCDRLNCELIINNNPLLSNSNLICYDCLNATLDYNNLNHADYFCRTFNIPFKPEIWTALVDDHGANIWKDYTIAILSDEEMQPNLLYTSKTSDIYRKVAEEWSKTNTFTKILNRMEKIKDSYIQRGHLKWGDQYTFPELLKLDALYIRTLKENNIINRLQKEAVRTLCQIQLSIDNAIAMNDTKSLKDLTTSYSAFAKEASLENMINETKTDDITTVAELYDYMEREGFNFKFYDGYDRDEVDRTIKDIQDTNKRLILESTGLTNLLEDMKRQREERDQSDQMDDATSEVSLQQLMDFHADADIATEDDAEVEDLDFGEEFADKDAGGLIHGEDE